MLSELRSLARALRRLSKGFDPALVSAADASAIVDAVTRIERAAGSLRARAAARAAEGPEWKRQGYGSPDEWLAAKTGTSRGQARKSRRLGERLARHEKTRKRLEDGEVSEDQADVVSGAAEENPDAEDDLLDAAEEDPFNRLKEKAAQAKAAASDEEERQARIHAERYGSGGTDEDGAYRLSARWAAHQGGIFATIWARFRDHVAGEAKRRGEALTGGQIGADALLLMAQTALLGAEGESGTLPLPEVRLNLLIDHDAFQRGFALRGERGEIDGFGPITVAQAQALAGDSAFVTASLFDGNDVFSVAHLGTTDPSTLSPEKVLEYLAAHGVDVQALEVDGRHVPAVLDTAITIRDRVCRHRGCGRRRGLQRDHVVAVALGGKTSYRQLQRLCWHHHQLKTEDDMRKIRARRAEAARAGAGAGASAAADANDPCAPGPEHPPRAGSDPPR